jgi:hypothetical protein
VPSFNNFSLNPLPSNLEKYFGKPWVRNPNWIKDGDILKESAMLNSVHYLQESIVVERMDVSQDEEENLWMRIGENDRYGMLIKIRNGAFNQIGTLHEYVIEDDN